MYTSDICSQLTLRVSRTYMALVRKFLLVALTLLWASHQANAQCGPTTTIYNADNVQEGVMFDITAGVDVTVTGFDINLDAGGPYVFEIYAKPGTHVGFETNPGAWTLVGVVPGVFGNGTNLPTPLPAALTVPIPSGTTTAFYITDVGTGNFVNYTTGLPTGTLVVNDGNISIFSGTGISYAFQFPTPDRVPNITVNYQCCPAPTATINSTSCPTSTDGSVNVTGQGTGPWSYVLLDLNGIVQGPSAPVNGPYLFSGVSSGNYVVASTDANGCTSALPVTVSPATGLTAPVTVVDNVCFGGTNGSASVNISGGSPPYNVVWNDPFGNSILTENGVTSSSITGLAAGNYSLSITDQSGCGQLQGVTITQPNSGTSLNIFGTNVLCFGGNSGTIEATCSGPSPSQYVLADVLGNILQTASSSTPYTFTGLVQGDYFITASDANGCQVTGTVTLTQPTALQLQTSSQPVLCHGGNTGSATINVISGGTAPYAPVAWDNGLTGNTISNLTAGTYTATVIDNLGCTISQTFTLQDPPAMILDGRYVTDTCGRGLGAAYVIASMGTPPYSYLWPYNSEALYINDSLAVGVYTVIVTDVNACVDSVHIEVKDDIAVPHAAFSYRFQGESFFGQEALFLNNSVGANQYTWRFGDGQSSNAVNPKYRYQREGDYLVMLVASNGFCTDTAYQYINIDPLETLYIPNAFTPGRNGKNDTFRPYGEGLDLESFDMKIYDRWGKLVWQTGRMSKEWDGNDQSTLNPVPVGNYVYEITFRDFADLDRHKVVGTVLVIRD